MSLRRALGLDLRGPHHRLQLVRPTRIKGVEHHIATPATRLHAEALGTSADRFALRLREPHIQRDPASLGGGLVGCAAVAHRSLYGGVRDDASSSRVGHFADAHVLPGCLRGGSAPFDPLEASIEYVAHRAPPMTSRPPFARSRATFASRTFCFASARRWRSSSESAGHSSPCLA